MPAPSLKCSHLVVLLVGVLAGTGGLVAAEPDPRVRPGASFVVAFPDLGPDRNGRPAQMEVRIPDDYDPEGLYPLMAWMGGGDGNHRAAGADHLVDTTRFVRIGLPFPRGANDPRQGNMVGDFPTMWAYHQHMLAELERIVPNLHPRMRIIGGFSNGAHTIDGELAETEGEFAQAFSAYLLVEGGHRMAAGRVLDDLRGRHLAVFWGADAGGAGPLQAYAAAAERAGMQAVGVAMAATGHEFPSEYRDQAARWIREVVMPGLVEFELAFCRHFERREPARAYAAARGLVGFAELPDDQRTELEELIAEVEAEAAADLERASEAIATAGGVDELSDSQRRRLSDELADIAAEWPGTPAADEAAALGTRLAASDTQ